VTNRSLHIGINYPGTSYELAGCVNDASDWASVLTERGYRADALIDANATRTGILAALRALVQATDRGDRLVVTYSGHGTWVPDRDDDEVDHRDEAICPVDLRETGVITDDDLYAVFREANYGARVLFVADSCYSGTLNRLAPPIHPDADDAFVENYRRARFLPPAVWTDDGVDQPAWQRAAVAPTGGRMRRGALVMAACSDTQTAYDARVDGRPCGIYSYVAVQALKSLPPDATYRQWQKAIRGRLPSVDYPDATPRLDGTSTQKRWGIL
jgi:metacaspase-1